MNNDNLNEKSLKEFVTFINNTNNDIRNVYQAIFDLGPQRGDTGPSGVNKTGPRGDTGPKGADAWGPAGVKTTYHDTVTTTNKCSNKRCN